MRKWFSIRTKFLTAMSGLMAACVVVYLLMAITVFKSDKTELVYDLNRSQVSNLASEIETQFAGVSDKLKLFALSDGGSQEASIKDIIREDSGLVYVALFDREQKKVIRDYSNREYTETYGLKSDFFHQMTVASKDIPFARIQKEGESFWSVRSQEAPPLIGFGRNVVVEGERGQVRSQMAVIGYVRLDRILKSLSLVRLSEISILNSQGELLAHRDARLLGQSMKESSKLFQAALDSKTKTSVLQVEENGHEILGAFSQAYKGRIFVLARAQQSEAFAVVGQLIERTLIFALFVMTAAFIISIFMSRSLTEPISKLVDSMTLVSQGDLSVQIDLATKDETKVLADSFNKMIFDLKQSRDELETINRELDLKVKERTRQLEEQNHAVKEAQEALLRTTRLASAGEIAGRAAHEVLNPLTSLLTRVGVIEKRVKSTMSENLKLFDEIRGAWEKDYADGGFATLTDGWNKPSSIAQGKNLFQEDMENLTHVSESFAKDMATFTQDTAFIQNEGARINRIINGMRKLSVTQSDWKILSVHQMLKECSNIMADLFEQENFKLIHEFSAGQDIVRADHDEFIQAVTNLMRNSLQALRAVHGRGERVAESYLKLRTYEKNNQLYIEIEDNGVGISQEHQERLFKGQFTTKNPDEGTGLGLGISRRFIRAHGGEIEFIGSTPLQSTVFCLRLPLQASDKKGVAA